MSLMNLIRHLQAVVQQWWRTPAEQACEQTHEAPSQSGQLPVNSLAFETFLLRLGVRMEAPVGSMTAEGQEPTSLTLLQRSQHYDALYRIEVQDGHPHLLVLLPAPLLLAFEGYLVHLHPSHPLVGTFSQFQSTQGSAAFESARATNQEHLLRAIAEVMKTLFWAGFAQNHFPPEIVVQRLLFIGEVTND